MNTTAYIFGDFGSGYTQYPDDSLSSFFSTLQVPKSNDSCISIYRSGDLAWCIYRRGLSGKDGRYIGLAVAFNSVCCTAVKEMFAIFGQTVASMTVVGKVLGYSTSGELVPVVSRLSLSVKASERITSSLASSFSALQPSAFTPLPPVNYAASSGERIRLGNSSVKADVVKALFQSNNIDISSGEGEDEPYSLAGRIREADSTVKSLSKKNTELENELSKVRKQKKRTTAVTLLAVSIAILFTVFMAVSQNLNTQLSSLKGDLAALENALEERQNTIAEQEETILQKSGEISSLNSMLSETKSELETSRKEVASLRKDKASLESKVSSQQTELRKNQSEISSLKTSLSTEKNDKQSWISYYRAKDKENTELKKQVSALQTQLNNLQQQIRNSGRRR